MQLLDGCKWPVIIVISIRLFVIGYTEILYNYGDYARQLE